MVPGCWSKIQRSGHEKSLFDEMANKCFVFVYAAEANVRVSPLV